MKKKVFFFFFQAEDGIRDYKVTGVQTCALPISERSAWERQFARWADGAGLGYSSAPELAELAEHEPFRAGSGLAGLWLAVGTQPKVTTPRVVDGKPAPDRLAVAMTDADEQLATMPAQLRQGRVLPVKVLQRPGWEPDSAYAVMQLSDLVVMVLAARQLAGAA